MAIGEAVLHTPPTARRNVSILDRARVRGLIRAEVYIHLPCWFHEPDFGARDTECTALAVLRLLKDDLKEATRRVDDEEAENGVSALVRRAARYYMYRQWVGEKWGKLGRGNRIRIPPCVVEYIRNEFREPDCTCMIGGALFNCTTHGYTGHRDASHVG